MSQIIVRPFKESKAFKRKNGLILMQGTKKTLYEYWLEVYRLDDVCHMPTVATRKKHLRELVLNYVWFADHYAKQPNSCTDFEISVFSEFYEVYLSRFLACDAVIVERGKKCDKKFMNFLSHLHEVDYIWNITKLVIEHHKIDWILFDGSTISVKS